MKLTICAPNIDKFVGKLQAVGVISKEWWRDPKYDLWMKYFQIKTDDVTELEDLLETAIDLKATHYILESDDAKEYFDGTPLPKVRYDLRESSSERYAIVDTFDGQYAPRYYYGNGIWDDFDEEDLNSDAWNGLNRTLVNLRQIPEEDLDDVVVYTRNTGGEFRAKEFLEKYDLRIRENKKIVRRQPRPVDHIR